MDEERKDDDLEARTSNREYFTHLELMRCNVCMCAGPYVPLEYIFEIDRFLCG